MESVPKEKIRFEEAGAPVGLFVSCVTLSILIFLTYSDKGQEKTNLFHNLQYQQNQEFLTKECLSKIKESTAECLKQQLSASALIYMKCGNHGIFFRFLLLLSGDNLLKPGPSKICQTCNKSVRKGLPCIQCGFWVQQMCDKIPDAEFATFSTLLGIESGYT